MDSEEEDQEPPERSSAAIGVAMAIILVGLAIGIGLYLTRQPQELSSQGLDMAIEPPPDPVVMAPAPPPPPPKTFGISSPLPIRPPMPAPTDAKGNAELGLADAAKRNETWFRNFTIKYQTKHPIVYSWGKEWITYPELKKARDDYYQSRNPVRFAFQIASSPNLPKMVAKYSGDPAMRGYVTDLAANAPSEVVKAFTTYLMKDNTAIKLVERFAAAAGLPPALAAGFTGRKVDEKEVMKQIMQQNPGLQGAPPVQTR